MTTPLLQQALEALSGVAIMKSAGQLDQFKGEPWLDRIDPAITAIQAHLSTSQAEQVRDWRVYLEFSTNDVLVRVGEKSWTFKEHGSVYGAMQKIVPALLGIR